MNHQILMTAAGEESIDFKLDDQIQLKHDIQIGNHSLIEISTDCYLDKRERNILILKQNAKDSANLIKVVNKYKNLSVIYTMNQTQGALCTSLFGIDKLILNEPLFVVPGDSLILGNFEKYKSVFLESDLDAGTLVFSSSDPRWSFARVDDNLNILEMAEKAVISNYASTGVFYFKNAQLYIESAEWVLENNMRTFNDFYVSSTVNYLVMIGFKTGAVVLDEKDRYISLSNANDIINYRSTIEAK
jgi:dTDP-glucose pyrophosphorylase